MQLEGDPRYVYVSSGEVYGDEQDYSKEIDPIDILEISNYGKFKFEAEELIRDEFRNHLIVRPSGFVGVGLKKNPIFDLMQGSQVFVHEESLFQFCDVDWFADTILNVALEDFIGTINVSASGSISIKGVIEQMKIQRPKFAPETRIELHRLNTDLLSIFVEVPSTFTHVRNYIHGVTNQNG
jgi:nucleoside-diphosphate-sugar epimerase